MGEKERCRAQVPSTADLPDERLREVYELSILYDFYGELLGGHKKKIFEDYTPENKEASAKHVLDDYFRALFLKDWSSAYSRLSAQDRTNISLRDFTDWRTAVSGCYEMQEYEIRPFRAAGRQCF